jgi:hypothetical protein
MNARIHLALATLIVAAFLIASCGGAPTPASTREAGAAREVAAEPTQAPAVATPAPTSEPIAAPASSDFYASAFPSRPNRLIVKNAELKLLVADTDVAIDRTTQIAADTSGYIISSRVRYDEWLGQSYKYASITIGVPVDQFELAMRRLRALAVQVVDETASGQDVTDEYVDLQSRLDNLIATRDRIRQFLDQAQTVEESLRVNEQLAVIEEQIEQVQGRMNYLFDRSAYSTITVQIDPELPQPTPAPTPTPTLTPTPTPPWSPTQTVQAAGNTLGSILRVLVRFFTELAIWTVVVIAPLVAPPALVIWGVYRWFNRRDRRGAAQ